MRDVVLAYKLKNYGPVRNDDAIETEFLAEHACQELG